VGAVSVGAGVVRRRVGTLVVARGGDELIRQGANQGRAGDHKGPHSAPRLPRPYGGSIHILLA